jgi:hypothetical protein
MQKIQAVGVVILIIVAIVMVLKWSAAQDEKLFRWAEQYEECVAKEYGGMTPTEYYSYHGEYPYCEVSN